MASWFGKRGSRPVSVDLDADEKAHKKSILNEDELGEEANSHHQSHNGSHTSIKSNRTTSDLRNGTDPYDVSYS